MATSPSATLGVALLAAVAFASFPSQTSAQAAPAPASPPPRYPTAGYVNLMQDVIINADLWDKEPRIFTANYAFEGIQGVVNGNLESYATAAGEEADISEKKRNCLTAVTSAGSPCPSPAAPDLPPSLLPA